MTTYSSIFGTLTAQYARLLLRAELYLHSALPRFLGGKSFDVKYQSFKGIILKKDAFSWISCSDNLMVIERIFLTCKKAKDNNEVDYLGLATNPKLEGDCGHIEADLCFLAFVTFLC